MMRWDEMKWKWQSTIKQRDKFKSQVQFTRAIHAGMLVPIPLAWKYVLHYVMLYYIHMFSHQISYKKTVRVTFTLSTYLCVSSPCARMFVTAIVVAIAFVGTLIVVRLFTWKFAIYVLAHRTLCAMLWHGMATYDMAANQQLVAPTNITTTTTCNVIHGWHSLSCIGLPINR